MTPVAHTLGGQLHPATQAAGLEPGPGGGLDPGPEDEAPPVERIQHWEHNRRRPRTRRELLTIARELHKLNPAVITLERIEQLIHTYDPRIPLTAEERAALGFVDPASAPRPPPLRWSPRPPPPPRAPCSHPGAGTTPGVEAATVALPPNPYRGLFAFREEDAPFFCGREAFTAQLLAAVQAARPGGGAGAIGQRQVVGGLCRAAAAPAPRPAG